MTRTTAHPDAAQLAQSSKSLARRLDGDVYFDAHRRALYSTDASLYQIQPVGVVVPRHVEDVRRAVAWAGAERIPLVPRGGGTSLSGQCIGPGLVLDFSKYMNRILELDPERRIARVEPGVVLDQLNAAAAEYGLQFGPDVATTSRANLGGMIGNNSAGSRSIRHGKMVDHVVELETILSDGSAVTFGPTNPARRAELIAGATREADVYRTVERLASVHRDEIIARYPRVLRRVSGYNLDELVPECRGRIPTPPSVELIRRLHAERYPGADRNLASLIVGAEGTLACVTGALVDLVPMPAARGIAVLHFESLTDSVDSINEVLQFQPSAVELFDGMIVDMARRSLEYREYLDFVVGNPASLVVVEFSGDSDSGVADAVTGLRSAMTGQRGLTHVLTALDPQQCAHIWACRKAALPLLMAVPGTRKPIAFVEDTAIDPPRIPQFVALCRELLNRNGTDGAFYGHASVGCLHIRPLIDTADREDLRRLARISDEVCELVLEFGGAMSGEHGDGLARSYLNERLFGPELYGAFRELKAAFDPEGLMNPGKVVDGPSPVTNLRHDPADVPLEIKTVQDFSREGGLVRAASLCSGVGVCRKTASGTMCPSFMATRDEEHSTRGRANALRLVLTGKVPATELTGRRLYETFDLCLQCKGCKGECPTNVDVAKLKSELLHNYWEAHGTPLGVHMMGRIAALNRIGSALAPLSNAMPQLPGARWLLEKLSGIDARRSLPRFTRQHFQRWFHNRPAPQNGAPRGDVILLDDCLTSYSEPNVNRAAVRVLEAAGYCVRLAGLGCCGRPLISKGLLGEARALATKNVAALAADAARGIPIVGCEPSCILTLCDEYKDLVPGVTAQQVAAAARPIEQLLAPCDLRLKARAARGVLHGHCHQKALVGLGSTLSLLRQVSGLDVEVLDSGCCGMAGSFGYEHYDLSMQIGERVLFPAVRKQEGGEILAPGVSCRHQIADGAGRRARHPIELVAEQIAPAD